MTRGSESSTSGPGKLELTQKSAPLVSCVFGLMAGVGLALFCTVTFPLIGHPLALLLSSIADLFGWGKTAQSLRAPDAARETAEILAMLLNLGIAITTFVFLLRKPSSSVDTDVDLDDDEEADDDIDTNGYIEVSYWVVGVAVFGALCLFGYFFGIIYYELPRAFYETSLFTLRFAAWTFDSGTIEAMAHPSESLADSMQSVIFWCAILFLIRPTIGRSTADGAHRPGTSQPMAGEG